MSIIGLCHTRNDDWCIGYTARVACQWVDKLLVYAHACVDRTVDILEQVKRENSGKVCVYIDPDPEWREMHHRQFMLEWARQLKATHIAIIDSDEAITANLITEMPKLVKMTPRGEILSLNGIQLWDGAHLYRFDGRFTAKFSLAFVDDPIYNWRPRGQSQYQHHCRPPQPLTQGWCPNVEGGILHFQFARLNALRHKQLLYEMRETLLWPEQGNAAIARKYSWWAERSGRPMLSKVPDSWMVQWLMKHLDLTDGYTWYEAEVNKLIKQHGKDEFAGLNDFGLGVLRSEQAVS